MPDIMHLVKIHASADQVYQAITTAEGVRNWWTRDTALELTPQTHVGWKMISSGLPAFDGTTVAFDLRANGGDTMLAFAHRGFKRADDGFAGATTRWGFYLVSLKRYLEGGQGSPNPVDADL